MNMHMKRCRKPNLMALLAFFVGLGVILTSISQAAEPARSAVAGKADIQQHSSSEQWLRSVSSLDLADKIKNWKPRIRVEADGDGVNLSRPFGTHGPALRLSTSIPEHARLSLSAGGDNGVGSAGVDAPGPYLFLHKRW